MDPNQIQPGVMPQQPMQPPMEASGGVMPPASGGEPVTDQEKQALIDIIAKIKAKLGDLTAYSFAAGNKSDRTRRDLLRQVFEKMQLAGVDLTDQQSVADFITRLRESNPELADMFEKSMEVLLGGNPVESGVSQDPTAIGQEMSPQNMNNNMNINPNENTSALG
jgi:hypothetical protein